MRRAHDESDVEQRQRATLAARAYDDDRAPVIPILDLPADGRPEERPRLLIAVAAAAVILVVAGALAFAAPSWRDHREDGIGPAPTTAVSAVDPQENPASCALPAQWKTAIAAGTVGVDHPANAAVGSGPDGTFLMHQTGEGTDELALVDADGRRTTVWSPSAGRAEHPSVSPDSAVSGRWVAFGLLSDSTDYAVLAWNRSSRQLATVRELSSEERIAGNLVIDAAPVVAGDTAYWVEHRLTNTRHETLVAQPLGGTGDRRDYPVADVDRLVVTDAGLLILTAPNPAPGTTLGVDETVTAGPFGRLPASLNAVRVGRWFTSDGATLRWLTGARASTRLLAWNPHDAVTTTAAPAAPLGARIVGPFLVSVSYAEAGVALDTRTGRTVALPVGLDLALTTGGAVVFADGRRRVDRRGAATIARVAIDQLAPVTC
ncbi:MAG: hypothetical protein ABJA87_05305 [bacterium]